ncbi:ribbon-helix-helix protein, CopG family [Jiangella sp. DSM 45060]|uniref:ribbon-helix-helix protein, CopG family n=1 Tax=Jiangella sp. DSM 45060 TaxID=1798224 RepID=UPI000879F459|nr:ribbon-helix-helix protein, CopG family [Jiangella sp. DSM 45060]SDT44294.1 Ribbon-helix-helix protein, copG family [Jiangella sp. DSM 45060]
MATNLRLRPEAVAALRAEAERSGRSQQDVLRAAVDSYLGIDTGLGAEPVHRREAPEGAGELEQLVAARMVRPPRTPYRRPSRRLTLPSGVTSAELLDRDDRV